MDERVSSADANRNFSRLLRGVREGRSYLVTSHSRPVARITPVEDEDEAMLRARDSLLARLEAQPIIKGRPWTRDELYEDEA